MHVILANPKDKGWRRIACSPQQKRGRGGGDFRLRMNSSSRGPSTRGRMSIRFTMALGGQRDGGEGKGRSELVGKGLDTAAAEVKFGKKLGSLGTYRRGLLGGKDGGGQGL